MTTKKNCCATLVAFLCCLYIQAQEVLSSKSYPKFAVISDIHFGNNEGEGPMVKVPQALKNLLNKTPKLDAIFVVGDLTDYGKSSQYDQLLTVFKDTKIVPADFPVYFMMGNHDNYSGEAAATHYSKLEQPLHQYIQIKEYPFITISMSGTSSDGYNANGLNFLSENLADAAKKYPGKPIFVFTHVPPLNTVYGSRTGEGGWGTSKFHDILSKYPQVIVFSGHSHFPLGDPRSIHQRNYTSVNDGSVTYSEIEPGAVNEGIHPDKYDYVTEAIVVNVYSQHKVEMERWDTYNNEEIFPRWVVSAPHDGSKFIYTDNRTGGCAPVFGNVVPCVTDIKNEMCKVSFSQATDDEVVHHYIVDLIDNEQNEIVCSSKIFSGYYLNAKMPTKLTVSFSGVPTGSSLKARVTAVDSYGNKSNEIESNSFTTEKYTPAPKSKAPVADLFDLQFGKNGKDLSARKIKVTTGSIKPITYFNKTYNKYAASFSGSGACYYKVNYSHDMAIKKAFDKEFTFELLYKTNNTNNVCPMSAQESGGAGIEQASGGLIQFYVHIGGGYKIVKSNVSAVPGKFYHVIGTYNKKAEKVSLFINGSPSGEISVKGDFGFPADTAAQWIGIGGDANKSNNAQFALNGEILAARMYSKSVNRDEVYWLYKAFEPLKNK